MWQGELDGWVRRQDMKIERGSRNRWEERQSVKRRLVGLFVIGFLAFLTLRGMGILPDQAQAAFPPEDRSMLFESGDEHFSGTVESSGSGCVLPEQLAFDYFEWPGGGGIPRRVFAKSGWPAIYRFNKEIGVEAGRSGIDCKLIASVIWVESSGDPLARSRSDAIGLMQIMPRDGKGATYWCDSDGDGVKSPCFADRPTIAELYDPQLNLRTGVDILGRYIDASGSVRGGLGRYFGSGEAYPDLVWSLSEWIGGSF